MRYVIVRFRGFHDLHPDPLAKLQRRALTKCNSDRQDAGNCGASGVSTWLGRGRGVAQRLGIYRIQPAAQAHPVAPQAHEADRFGTRR